MGSVRSDSGRLSDRRSLAASVAVVLLPLALGFCMASSARANDNMCHDVATNAAMRVNVDPATGRIVASAVPAAPSALQAGASFEDPLPVPLAGGGYKIDTSARYLHWMRVEAAGSAAPRTSCERR